MIAVGALALVAGCSTAVPGISASTSTMSSLPGTTPGSLVEHATVSAGFTGADATEVLKSLQIESGAWDVVGPEGDTRLVGSGTPAVALLAGADWRSVTVMGRLSLGGQSVGLVASYRDHDNFLACTVTSGTVQVVRVQGGTKEVLASVDIGLPPEPALPLPVAFNIGLSGAASCVTWNTSANAATGPVVAGGVGVTTMGSGGVYEVAVRDLFADP